MGIKSPPVFVLADQNFYLMILMGGGGQEGECLKIIQIENGTLVELVTIFFKMTKGFSIPFGHCGADRLCQPHGGGWHCGICS
jgi:hypothetical protein